MFSDLTVQEHYLESELEDIVDDISLEFIDLYFTLRDDGPDSDYIVKFLDD